jgi:hypothetical protein
MTYIERMGHWLDFMPLGTWGEWFGAVGSMVAAAGALWLLKREGDDRRDLQRAESERIESQRREQASRVYLAYTPGWISHSGDRETQQTNVRIVNGSSEVLTSLAILVRTRGFEPGNHARRLQRLLPGEQRELPIELTGPDSTSDGGTREERWFARRVELMFENSRGLWHIDDHHVLRAITYEERRDILSHSRGTKIRPSRCTRPGRW